MLTASQQEPYATAFDTMVARLSRLSVTKHFDAYGDVAWDDPELAVRPLDARVELPVTDPIAASDWYRNLPPDKRAELGLYRLAACMKIGWHFENLLQRGLLAYALKLPNDAPELRYLNHEIIEEGQHTLMFQEFVKRSQLPVRGMARSWRMAAELTVVRAAKRLPPLFFLLVLGGEEPADHLQRVMLRNGIAHPLVERIIRIHVTEEARHVSFASQMLRRDVPALNRFRRARLAVAGPVVLGLMARMMLEPPSDLRHHTGMPWSVQRAAFRSPVGRRLLAGSVAKPRALWQELGLIPRWARPLWKAFGIAG